MDENKYRCLVFLYSVFAATGEIIVQTTQYCSICTRNEEFCRNPPFSYTRYKFLNREFDEISSNVGQTYQDGRNCIVSITASPNNQIEVQLMSLNVDSYAELDDQGLPKRCYDYLKLFNGPTVDNAKMFPSIPPSGICGTIRSGSDMAGLKVFKTTGNHLTIQFVTDSRRESFGGFRLRILQYSFSNAGNLYPTGENLGGWNAGSFNEFQVYWDQLNVIPGGIFPGTGGTDYGSDTSDGVECYSCNSCPVEPFDPVAYGISTDKGCHTCSKEWDDSYNVARRKCYSLTDYNLILESLSDGIDTVQSFSGCKQFVTQYGRTVNYCFCRKNKCNSGHTVLPNKFIVLISCILISFCKIWVS